MIPALFGVSVSQINLLLDTLLASFLESGSVSWLYYSDRLNNLPLGIFAIAIGVVILPALSRNHADKQADHFSHTLDWADRKSTRLNSSHVRTSYAVFCLKKKKTVRP